MLHLLRRVFFTLIVCGLAVSGWLAFGLTQVATSLPAVERPTAPTKLELARAMPPTGLVLAGEDCVEPTASQVQAVEAAIAVLALPDLEISALGTGAEKFLSRPQFRTIGEESHRVCDDPSHFERAQKFIIENKRFMIGRLVDYGLNLIARLPNPSQELIDKVADVAFNDWARTRKMVGEISAHWRDRSWRPSFRPVAGTPTGHFRRYRSMMRWERARRKLLSLGVTRRHFRRSSD